MNEPTLTAEDLTLYALNLLEGDEQERVEAMLRASTEARKELANIRGDLAMFALGAEQHTPPALTRQRLLKQVARERRNLPIEVPLQERSAAAPAVPQTFSADLHPDADPVAPTGRVPARTTPPEPQTTLQTFPSRLQQRAAAQAQRPVRSIRETEPERPAAAEAGAYVSEQQTLPPMEPQAFIRDTPTPMTSASAHSVTMFEQHFAGERNTETPEAVTPADPDFLPRNRQRRADPLDGVDAIEDRFVPSARREERAAHDEDSFASREETFAFSSYRDRLQEEASPASAASRLLGWSGWVLATAASVAAAVALRDDFILREQVSQQRSALTTATASAAKAEAVMQTLQSPAAQRFVLARTDAAPAPGGRVVYLPERGSLVFQASNLETLQPYKTYELWLIPAGEGRQPVPAGTFKPDGRGYASVVLPPLPKGMVAANFGVTIEDEGGSATPTLPILLVGQQA